MVPKVSVVMSVYNGSPYLREAISSILTQSFSDFEFIIIDDGSTDNSVEIITSFNDSRILLVRQNNTGLAKALNKGIAISNTSYIVRMDADDISLPDRIKLQFEFLEKTPHCIAVGSNAIEIDKDGKYIFTSNLLLTWKDIKEFMIKKLQNKTPWNPFYHSSITFRKDAFYITGGYNEIITVAEDVILFTKMLKIGQLWNLEVPLIKYRIVPSAMTIRKIDRLKFFRNILIKAIDDKKLSNEEVIYLNKIAPITNIRNRKTGYYMYLGKNYLLKNFQPKLSRKNLLKALLLNPFYLQTYILLILTFFPKRNSLEIYNFFKKVI